jgi:hypothetical protein
MIYENINNTLNNEKKYVHNYKHKQKMNSSKGWTNFCPYNVLTNPLAASSMTSTFPVDVNGSVPVELRASGPNDAMPLSPPNGGLYGGPQSVKPWANIPVTPTVANLISNNLRSANPPPGATEQYPSTERLGNNYIGMPHVYWYSADGKGPYGQHRIQGL